MSTLVRLAASCFVVLLLGCGGADGATGSRGEPGDAGVTGATGARGPAGNDGLDGDPGSQGDPGEPGEQGVPGDQGPPGSPGSPPIDTTLGPYDDLPGLVIQVGGVSGGSGPDGQLQPDDPLSVTFSVALGDGTPVPLDQIDFGGIFVSGPTAHYQRVFEEQFDLLTEAVDNGDGTVTYTFAEPFPQEFIAPLNDSDSFGADDGELQGTPIEAGTYTVGIELFKNYTVGLSTFRDAGNATLDFLVGDADALETRDVIGQTNCNSCHQELRAHGDIRRSTKLCVLCHTAGAEDKNDPAVAGGTPGVSIEFQVLIHKLHDGAHLPSVLGVATKADGSRDYAAQPRPYEVVGFQDEVTDFSDVGFPVMPNMSIPMPRDVGFGALPAAQQGLEDAVRTGAAACDKCHGDADGDGPEVAPADGHLAYEEPSRRPCGACHDDVSWGSFYSSNGMTMPAQVSDDACAFCHVSPGSSLSVETAHLHPLHDAVINPGINVTLTNVAEAGASDGDGTIDPGEKVAVTFTITDDLGAAVPPASVASISAVLSGPTSNYNLVLNNAIPTTVIGAGPSFTVNLPEAVALERIGKTADDAAMEAFPTSRAPHLNVAGATTTVYARTATGGGATSLAAGSAAGQNFVDVLDATGFARNDYVVLEDGSGTEEYRQITYVTGTRLWIGKLAKAHAAGGSALEVTLSQKKENVDYTLTAATGTVTEAGAASFAQGTVLVASYTSNFVMPAVFPPPLNDSPDLGEGNGEWSGKPIVDGTYTLAVWASRSLCVKPGRTATAASECTAGQPGYSADNTSYRPTSPPANWDLLVGSAAEVEPYALVSDGETCNSCHGDIMFHGGGRRGFDTCILCHGTAGSEDRAKYTAANAPATDGVTIDFRGMVHALHRGRDLAHADDYAIVGFGSAAYPNNFGVSHFGEIEFPAMPGGVKQCAACHGSSDAWMAPAPRDYPAAGGALTKVWGAACGSCHDSAAAGAHIELNTTAKGAEACPVCHDNNDDLAVSVVHKAR